MKDFLGNELSVGDHVVFSRGTYSDNLTKGVVTKINPKMLRIRCKPPKNWDERQYPSAVVKITKEQYDV